MTKYKVYLKGGTVLEVQAGAAISNEQYVHFFEKSEKGSPCLGSFLVAEISGFFKADLVKTVDNVRPINPAS